MSGQANRSPAAQAAREIVDRARGERAARDLRRVLSLPEGRRVIQGWMELFGLFDDIPPNNNAVMQHLVGKRSAALVMRNDVRRVNPALLPQMEQELASEPPLPTGDATDGGQEA